MELADLRTDVETLTRAVTRVKHLAASGQTATLDLSPCFRELPHVATSEAFGLVREAVDRSEGKRAARLKVLLRHIRRLMEESATAGALAAKQAGSIVDVSGTEPGEKLPVRVALEELGLVGDREKRSLFERRAVDGLEAEDSAHQRELETLQSVAQRTGFATAATAHASLSGLELAALATDAEAFLSTTAAMYEDVVSWWLRRTTALRIFPHGAERHDLLHALALVPYDGLFPKGRDVGALAGKLSAMGLAPLAGGRLRIDDASRATKATEPVVAPLDPPAEVVASYRPRRGYAGTRDFLRALGTGLHFANVEPERPFEDRALGDRAVPLAAGELFGQWLLDAKWLKRNIDAELPDLVRMLALVELARWRLEAALLLWSLRVDRDGATGTLRREFAERISQTMCVAWPAGLWLHDVDTTLGQADALRGKMLAAAWGEQLRERFDEDWWRNPQAGPALRKVFAKGQQDSAEETAKGFGAETLSLTRVARQFEAMLDSTR